MYIRVFFAFFIGFVQFLIPIFLEIMTLWNIISNDSFIGILLGYAALTGIVKVDLLWANSIQEHPI